MVMIKTKKGDFVELDFSAYANDVLIDTTQSTEAKKFGFDIKNKKFEPLVLCIGEGAVLKGLDKELEDKELNKDYEIKLKADEAFGKRNPALIKTVGLGAFKEMPQVGMLVNVDGVIAKVISITGGRVLIDFNHPLAGKEIIYKFRINSIVENNEKKIKALAKSFDIEIERFNEGENKIAVKNFKKINKKIIEDFKKKVKELLGTELTIE